MKVYVLVLSDEPTNWQAVGAYSSQETALEQSRRFDWLETDVWEFALDESPDPNIGL